jgi:hypothetical protein
VPHQLGPGLRAAHDLLEVGQERLRGRLVAELQVRAEPGWAALTAGLEAIMRLGLDHQVAGQLLNWRPVPGFEPSAEAFAPSIELVADIRRLLAAAVGRGEVHPAAASEDGAALLSVLVAGVMSQQLANQPRASWDQGRFTRLTPRVLQLFQCAYPPRKENRGER